MHVNGTGVHILKHIVDDFGNVQRVCDLPYDVYMTRCDYFQDCKEIL